MSNISFKNGLVVLGLITISIWILNTIALIWRMTQSTPATTKRYGAKSWAMVTGCTDGIGLSIANELASRGFNIVLLAKDLSKLKAISQQIELKFKV
jgi:17beta-estradiol 17-dehydrogenase / very-long-chain 3-oxoacyl-CoA reductase